MINIIYFSDFSHFPKPIEIMILKLLFRRIKYKIITTNTL